MPHGSQHEMRQRIEAELLKRVDEARKEHERWKADSHKLAAISAGTAGTPDGALARQLLLDAVEAANLAQDRYETALKQFTDFILKGIVPPDLDPRPL